LREGLAEIEEPKRRFHYSAACFAFTLSFAQRFFDAFEIAALPAADREEAGPPNHSLDI
jgi:predicted small metal-binding protein